jgi:hypothetical protein
MHNLVPGPVKRAHLPHMFRAGFRDYFLMYSISGIVFFFCDVTKR